MRRKTEEGMFALLYGAALGEISGEEIDIPSESLPAVFALCQRQDMAHLLCHALEQRGGLPKDEWGKRLVKARSTAVYRYETQKYALDRVCLALEKAKIGYMPLKGSVTRGWYAQPWLRQSCDIDILVKGEDLERAVSVLESVGCKAEGKGFHDVSLRFADGTHIELHFSLAEGMEQADKVLAEVWQNAENEGGRYAMNTEFLLFYHTAHAAYHFQHGGCGVKDVLDLAVLQRRAEYDKNRLNELLQRGGLARFYTGLCSLAETWFVGQPQTELTERMTVFLLRGGVYGCTQNLVAAQQQTQGGKVRYAFRRVVLPSGQLKTLYPILEKHKWLAPMMQVRRWCKILFGGKAKRAAKELKYNRTLDKEQAKTLQTMLQELGLL